METPSRRCSKETKIMNSIILRLELRTSCRIDTEGIIQLKLLTKGTMLIRNLTTC